MTDEKKPEEAPKKRKYTKKKAPAVAAKPLTCSGGIGEKGREEKPIGSLTGEFFFLANDYRQPVRFSYDNLSWDSVEAAYQAAKTGERRLKMKFSKMKPCDATAWGNRLETDDEWRASRGHILYELLELKFAEPSLREALLATGSRDIRCGGKIEKMLMLIRSGLQKKSK